MIQLLIHSPVWNIIGLILFLSVPTIVLLNCTIFRDKEEIIITEQSQQHNEDIIALL